MHLRAPTDLERAADKARRSHRQITTAEDREFIKAKTALLKAEMGKG